MFVCVWFGFGTFQYVEVFICAAVSHHGDILSCLLEFIFDTSSDVSQVGQRKLFELHRPQNTSMGLEHLQSLDNTHKD